METEDRMRAVWRGAWKAVFNEKQGSIWEEEKKDTMAAQQCGCRDAIHLCT